MSQLVSTLGRYAFVAIILGLAVAAHAGPIDPPTGPVGPTGRVPISSLPFTASTPGLYYVTGNLTYAGGGIVVTADDVVIDLGGFDLVSVQSSGTAVTATGSNVTVRNGRVLGWFDGLVLGNHATVSGVYLSGVGVEGAGRAITAGAYSVVERCEMYLCSSDILLGASSTVRFCQTSRGDRSSIVVGDHSRVEHCRASTGGYNNPVAISAGHGSLVANCTTYLTSSFSIGIQVGNGSQVVQCTATPIPDIPPAGAGRGILAGSNCLVEGCFVVAGALKLPTGIVVGPESIVHRCSVRAGTGAVHAGDGSRITECSAISAAFTDISAVQIGSNGVVSGCHIRSGTDGVLATGTGNTIDGNTIIAAAAAVRVTGSESVVIRNRIRGAAVAIDMAPGNAAAQVITVSGFFTMSDPLANIQF